MTDQLFPIETAATNVEFIGFDGASIVEAAPPEADGGKSALPVKAKPRRRRASKLEKHVAVRVWFDGRELAKLNVRAAAQDMALPEYLRLRALRDPRVRNRQAGASGGDLFARAEITQTTTVVRLSAPLSPEMEERITAYFSPASTIIIDPARNPPMISAPPSRPNVIAKLTQFLTVLVGTRWPGQRAAPPART
jgi:hypothetical protein